MVPTDADVSSYVVLEVEPMVVLVPPDEVARYTLYDVAPEEAFHVTRTLSV